MIFDKFKKKEVTDINKESDNVNIGNIQQDNSKIMSEEEIMIKKISNEIKEMTTIDNYKIGFKDEKCDFFDLPAL